MRDLMTEKGSSARRSNQRGQAARDQILGAATILFAERGFTGTSLSDIAAEASVSKASILYHFPDKERLWIAVVEALWTEVEDFFDESWPRQTPPSSELLETMLDLFIEAAVRWPAYIRIPFIEGMSPSWRSEWLADRHFRNHVLVNDRILRALQARGLIIKGDSAHVQALLTSAINVVVAQGAMWNRTFERTLTDKQSLKDLAKLTLTALLRPQAHTS
jgi:AcrR family transcriptional regulator